MTIPLLEATEKFTENTFLNADNNLYPHKIQIIHSFFSSGRISRRRHTELTLVRSEIEQILIVVHEMIRLELEILATEIVFINYKLIKLAHFFSEHGPSWVLQISNFDPGVISFW